MTLIERLKESKPGINDLVTVNFTPAEFRQLIGLLDKAQELAAALAEHQESLPTAVSFEDCDSCQEIFAEFTSVLVALTGSREGAKGEKLPPAASDK